MSVRFEVDATDSGAICIAADRAAGGREGFGFEGGRVLAEPDGLHLFTTELVRAPIWVHTEYGHWFSADGVDWRRVGTILRSTGDQTGADQRAALFSPMPVFDESRGRWQLFYVAYRSEPDTDVEFRRNHSGVVIRAESVRGGRGGIGGPYEERRVVLSPGGGSQPWEGLQGVDSFFPFQKEGGWLAFYGSATTQFYGERLPDGSPKTRWAVGLASADSLTGPWRRMEGNPCEFEPRFIENPVVSRLADGTLVAVYENASPTPELARSFGLAWSTNGRDWHRHPAVAVPDGVVPWVTRIRTPLGLIEEPDGFRVWFTGFSASETDPLDGAKGSVGMLRVRRVA